MTGPSQYQRLPVLDAWDETAMLRAIRVDLGGLSETHQVPGQVVKIRTAAGEGYFALASAPAADRRADLLLKRGGRIADAAVAAAAPSGALELTPPFGNGSPIAEAEGRVPRGGPVLEIRHRRPADDRRGYHHQRVSPKGSRSFVDFLKRYGRFPLRWWRS